jgi:hypothetical protein
VAKPGEPDDGHNGEDEASRRSDDFDFFAHEHRLLRELETVRRKVRRAQALRQEPATAEEREEVRRCHDLAMAAWRNNEEERRISGSGADDLEKPPPWWQIEAELESVPDIGSGQPVDVTVGVESLVKQVLDSLERKHASETKERPGVKPTKVSDAHRKKVAELRINGKSVAEIMRQTGLSKTIATRLVGDVDAVLGQIRSGRY